MLKNIGDKLYEKRKTGALEVEQIVKLLALLENESPRVRKLSLLFFALVVSNPKSKVYFLEKCGFGLSFGKVLFTRLKYLQNAVPRGLEPASVVRRRARSH